MTLRRALMLPAMLLLSTQLLPAAAWSVGPYESPWPGAGGTPPTVSAPADPATTKAEGDAPSAASREPRGIERRPGDAWVLLLRGSGDPGPSGVTATYQCFFCAPITVSKTSAFDEGSAVALRGGRWGLGGNPVLGAALEMGREAVDAPDAQFSVGYLSLMPMVHATLRRTAGTPGGLFDLYAGFVITRVIDGDASVTDPAFPRTVSGQVSGGGAGVVLGAGANWHHFRFQIEQRSERLRLSFSDFSGDEGRTRVSTDLLAFGAGWLF